MSGFSPGLVIGNTQQKLWVDFHPQLFSQKKHSKKYEWISASFFFLRNVQQVRFRYDICKAILYAVSLFDLPGQVVRDVVFRLPVYVVEGFATTTITTTTTTATTTSTTSATATTTSTTATRTDFAAQFAKLLFFYQMPLFNLQGCFGFDSAVQLAGLFYTRFRCSICRGVLYQSPLFDLPSYFILDFALQFAGLFRIRLGIKCRCSICRAVLY